MSAAKVYGLEPFGTLVARMEMTPAQMRRMIVSKYNDPVNAKEAHRIDLISTTPYVIVTDAADNALDVQFPKLREGRKYKVAVSDYIYRNYKDMEYTGGEITVEKVADILLEELRDDSPLKIDNTRGSAWCANRRRGSLRASSAERNNRLIFADSQKTVTFVALTYARKARCGGYGFNY